MKGLNLFSRAAGFFLLASFQIVQAGSVTYMKGSDGSNAHQYKNPCKVWVKADPGMVIRKNLYLEPRSYTLPITIGAAAGWKIVSAKYKNTSGQNVALTPPTAATAISWTFSISKNLAGAFDGKILTVHFATQRQTPSGRPDYEEDIVVYGNIVSSLAVLDVDGNRLYDQWEIQYFGSVAQDPYADPDKDGFSNLQEMQNGTDPLRFTDTIYSLNADTDTDGLPDWWEMAVFGTLANSGSTITANSNGLTAKQLYAFYVQQAQSSTVGDGIPDSWKQAHQISITDPTVATKDPDEDGLANEYEYDANTDPQKWDTDGDYNGDGEDLYPLVKNLSLPYCHVEVPSWNEQSQSSHPDYSKVDYTVIDLKWSASENTPSGYIVERRINSDIWQTIATVGGNTLKYSDNHLLANQHYQYRVTAFKNVPASNLMPAQKVFSDSAITDYDVPVLLSFDVKQSYLSRSKSDSGAFGEFINPSSPPKFYLKKTESWGYEDDDDKYTYLYVSTINPAEKTKTYHGEYTQSRDYSHERIYGPEDGESTWTKITATGSTYDKTEKARSRTRLESETKEEYTTKFREDGGGHVWAKVGHINTTSTYWENEVMSLDYLMKSKFAPNGDAIWNGNDFDLSKGTVSYSGNASTSDVYTDSNPIWNTTETKSSTINPTTGSWTPFWNNGGWRYANSNHQPVYDLSRRTLTATTATKKTYTKPDGKEELDLSSEYTTDAFIADVIYDMPDYPKDWTINWYGLGNFPWGFVGFNSWGYYGNWYTYGYPWYGRWVASRDLAKDEKTLSVGKMKYRMKASPSAPYTLKWYVMFAPQDDLATPDVDESKNIQKIREEQWTLGATANQKEFEVADAVTRTQNGYYTIVMQPVHLGVDGVGEAGKDVSGQDTNPGKVILTNDDDVDNDGVPDYADGYKLNSQIPQGAACDGVSFTPVSLTMAAVDPEHAKIRFTYDDSDPMQVTSTQAEPFKLPTAGKIRVWTTDAPGRWEGGQEEEELHHRNGLPVKSGGDFIKPGVEYSFSDLGIDSSSALTFYVEAVKTSGAVADIPIKVEVDPTGSMGYVWSDQLRFTASKIQMESKGLKTLPFATTPVFQPASLKNYYENMALFAAPAKPFSISRVKVTDPRKNLKKVTIQHADISLSQTGGIYSSQEFIGIRPNSGENRPMEQVQAPIIPNQAQAPVEVAGTIYNKPQLPWPIRDIKKVDDGTDDVGIENIPPKTPDEDDNEYIQRPLNDKQIAFIEPHGAANNVDPEMPHLVAKLPGEPSHDLKVRWKLVVEYKRGNGYRDLSNGSPESGYVHDYTRPEDTVKIPVSGEYTPEMAADQEWRIFENNYQGEVTSRGFFGGTAKLYIWFPIKGKEPTEPFMTFRIGGKNPDETKAETFIKGKVGGDDYLSCAYKVARHETYGRVRRSDGKIKFYNQFWTDFHAGKIGDDAKDMSLAAWAKGWPLYNLDRNWHKKGQFYTQNGKGGYGLFQLTWETDIERKRIWNWQDNVDGAVTELNTKKALSVKLFNGLVATYGALDSYRGFTGKETIIMTYYNGMYGGQLKSVNLKGIGFRLSCWSYENGHWTFLPNSQNYVDEAADHQNR